ncbi:CBS domain-containing protein [Haloferula sp.]|uniref:CBS domain-containing protein n=1 Tax=Haloferula sp. TaxID=2497595 RepID=UPI0032A01844
MSRHVITLTHGDPISKVRKTFTDSGVGHLPVVNNGNLAGIVSWTDLMRVSFGDAFGESTAAVDATLDHTLTLEDIMESDPVTLDHTATIREAATILAKADFHSLPVIDGNHLVGIVTSTDLISYLNDLI